MFEHIPSLWSKYCKHEIHDDVSIFISRRNRTILFLLVWKRSNIECDYLIFNNFTKEKHFKGSEIFSFQSYSIENAIIEMDWTKLSVTSKKDLLMMMKRTTKPILFSIGPIMNMNIQSFLSVKCKDSLIIIKFM